MAATSTTTTATITTDPYTYVDAFNSKLKTLAKFSVAQSRKLKIVDFFMDIDKRITLAINESPLTAMELVGPKLLKYADQIKERNVAFFLAADFSGDMNPDEDEAGRKETIKIIKIIKDVYARCSAADKDSIADLVDDMLINYCGYMQLTAADGDDGGALSA